MNLLPILILALGPSVIFCQAEEPAAQTPGGEPRSEGQKDQETIGDRTKKATALPDPARLESLLDALIRPFLGGWKGKLASPKAEEGLRVPLRALMGDIEAWAGTHVPELAARRPMILSARNALVSGLASELGGAGRRGQDPKVLADCLVKTAVKENGDLRQDRLERSIICWCPKEEWTRTLAGCAEGCADEQRELIKDWLEEGCTDAEVLGRMEGHPKGGPRVRAVPELTGTNWFAYLFPILFFGAAVSLVAVVLHRVTSHGKPASREVKNAAPLAADPNWDQRIEEELKELES